MCLIAVEEGVEDGGDGDGGSGRDGGGDVGGRGRRPSPGDRYTAEYYRLRLQDPLHEKCSLTLVQVLFALLSNKRSGQVKDGPFANDLWFLHHKLLPSDNILPPTLYLAKLAIDCKLITDHERQACSNSCKVRALWSAMRLYLPMHAPYPSLLALDVCLLFVCMQRWPHIPRKDYKLHGSDKCGVCGAHRFKVKVLPSGTTRITPSKVGQCFLVRSMQGVSR